jgi:hypothetical protein
LTPFELVNQHYKVPAHIEPRPLQIEAINELAPLKRQGEWLDMGTGKTFVSTWCALYWHILQGLPVIVLMPPILIRQWANWLSSITPAPSFVEYVAKPKQRNGEKVSAASQRAALDLNVQFILCGYQIFYKERARFQEHFAGREFCVIADEASYIGSLDANIHDFVYDLAIGQHVMMLSGTPSDPPLISYGLMKFTAPGSYRNYKHFLAEHVEEWDFFDRPKKYCNLDILNANLAKNSKRVLFSDMYDSTEEPHVALREYDLEPAHAKLYRKIADEQLLEMPDGGKLDLTSATRLIHALGQLIVNYGHFSGNEKHRSSALDLIDEKMEEMGTHGKLVVFAHYRLTVAHMVQQYKRYGAVGINSEVSATNKEKHKQRFMHDDKCRMIVVQYQSAALGLDGLQSVSHRMVLFEPPQAPRYIRQAIGRLYRGGQKYRVMVDIGVAEQTLQVRAFKNLLNNDEVINATIRNKEDLRRMVYGQM